MQAAVFASVTAHERPPDYYRDPARSARRAGADHSRELSHARAARARRRAAADDEIAQARRGVRRARRPATARRLRSRARRPDGASHDDASDPAAHGTRRLSLLRRAARPQRVLERDDECGRARARCIPPSASGSSTRASACSVAFRSSTQISIWVTWPQDAPMHGEMRNLSLNGMSFTSTVLFAAEPNRAHRLQRAARARRASRTSSTTRSGASASAPESSS